MYNCPNSVWETTYHRLLKLKRTILSVIHKQQRTLFVSKYIVYTVIQEANASV